MQVRHSYREKGSTVHIQGVDANGTYQLNIILNIHTQRASDKMANEYILMSLLNDNDSWRLAV